MEAHFTLLHHIPGLSSLPVHTAGAVLVLGILTVLALISRYSMVSQGDILIPKKNIGILSLSDIVAEALYKFTESVLDEDAKKFYPLIGSIFLYIIFSNFLGLIPGMLPPTDNMNTTFAIGLFVFVYYNYIGIKEGGLAYLKHFMGPVWYIAWLLLPIELISHAVRPFSLGLRLSGNMQGDHMVVSIMTDLSPAGLILPIPFYALGIIVCSIQAFVFSLLTMLYIKMAKITHH